MEGIDDDRLKQAVSLAASVADGANERYRDSAFELVLRHLLGGTDRVPVDRDRSGERGGGRQDERVRTPSPVTGALPPDHVIKERGSRDQQTVWAIAKLQDTGTPVTTDEIISQIRGGLGVKPESGSNTAKRLTDRLYPKYITRTQRAEGQGYEYGLTDLAPEVFEGLDE